MKIIFLKTLDSIIGRVAAYLMPRCGKPAQGVGKKYLFIRPGGIGDAVFLVPAVSAVLEQVPDAKIDILCERRNAGVFALCPGIDNVFLYDRCPDLLRVLRRFYDVVVDTEQWHRLSAVIGRIISSGRRVGYGTNERRRLLTDSLQYNHSVHEADCFRSLVKAIGIHADAVSLPFLTVPEAAQDAADCLLSQVPGERLVVVFPGASISERRWGKERFADLAAGLVEKGLKAVVVGGRVDAADAEYIAGRSGGMSLAGKTSLAETAGVLNRASLVVSGDSGILHIAVGLGVPTASLFGPGIQEKWGPRGENHIVINKRLPCSPCTKFGYTPKCPHDARCMKEITVNEVETAVLELLRRIDRNKIVDTAEGPQV